MRRRNTLATAIALLFAGTSCAAFAQAAPSDSGTSSPLWQLAVPTDPGTPNGPATLPLFNWATGLGYEHTDNINRSSVNRTSQDILQPTFNFTYTQQGSTVQAQAAGVIQYVDYLQNYFGNEFRGQLSGTMNWTISPQRLNFSIQDYSSVEPVSIRASNAPSNQQQVNVFVAGPTLSFRMGDALRGEADLRYVNTTASKTKDFNSQRGLGAFRAIRDLSPTDTLAFNAEAVHVDFSNINPTTNLSRYDQYNAYLRYQSHLQRIDLDVALGGSHSDFGQSTASHSGVLVRAGLGWRISPRSTLQANVSDQFADSTTSLIQAPALGNASVTDLSIQVGRTAISPTVYRDRGVNLSYSYQGSRFGFIVTPYYTRLRQLNGNDLSRNGYGAIANATYAVSPLMTLGVTVGSQSTQYVSDHSRDRDSSYTVDLTRQFTPHWSWRVAVNRASRNSTRPGFNYYEDQVFVILYYSR